MPETPWLQINISYPGDTRQQHERHALAHLGQVLPAAETAGLITSWWFIRKGAWRIRFLPTDNQNSQRLAHKLLTDGVSWTNDIYEPETHAFGGADTMTAAHTLFHHDSRHLLAYFGTGQPRRRTFLLQPGVRYRADVLDTWNMTISELPGTYEADFTLPLPGRPYIAVRLRAVED